MNKEEQLKEAMKSLYAGLDGAALLSTNEDGSLNVIREEQSDYSFVVFDSNCKFDVLLDKFKQLGYVIDLDTYRGLIPPRDLIRVDITHKTISRPLVVSINHYNYLREKESILVEDVLNAFDEMVINKNKTLLDSLYQMNRRK